MYVLVLKRVSLIFQVSVNCCVLTWRVGPPVLSQCVFVYIYNCYLMTLTTTPTEAKYPGPPTSQSELKKLVFRFLQPSPLALVWTLFGWLWAGWLRIITNHHSNILTQIYSRNLVLLLLLRFWRLSILSFSTSSSCFLIQSMSSIIQLKSCGRTTLRPNLSLLPSTVTSVDSTVTHQMPMRPLWLSVWGLDSNVGLVQATSWASTKIRTMYTLILGFISAAILDCALKYLTLSNKWQRLFKF